MLVCQCSCVAAVVFHLQILVIDMPRRPAPSTGDATRDAKNAKERERRRQRASSAISGPHQQQEEEGSASSSGAAAVSEEAITTERYSSSLSQLIVLPGGSTQRSVILKVVDGSNNSKDVKIFSYIDLIRCHLKQENIEVHNDYDRNTLHKICEIYGIHEPYEAVGGTNPDCRVLARILTPESCWALKACPCCRNSAGTGPKVWHRDLNAAYNIRACFYARAAGQDRPTYLDRAVAEFSNSPAQFHPELIKPIGVRRTRKLSARISLDA